MSLCGMLDRIRHWRSKARVCPSANSDSADVVQPGVQNQMLSQSDINFLALDKSKEVAIEAIFVGNEETVRGSLIHFELASRDCLSGSAPAGFNGCILIPIPMNDQCRNVDRRHIGPKVGLEKCVQSFRHSVR